MHKEAHFTGSERIRDVVIGMADGLTVPFALAAGLSGAVSNTALIVAAGLAEIAAGSIAMGLGGYLAGRTEAEHYQAELVREREEIVLYPDTERREVEQVLTQYGVSEGLAIQVAQELSLRPAEWVDFMMRFELGLEEPRAKRAMESGALIAGAYIVGGLIPLTPYFLVGQPSQALVYSVAITLVCLFGFGYLKARITSEPALAGAIRVTLIGAVAAAAAYAIAVAVAG